jgi:hypothetical protein
MNANLMKRHCRSDAADSSANDSNIYYRHGRYSPTKRTLTDSLGTLVALIVIFFA